MNWQHWIDRWDRQQEGYLGNRELRFRVIGDVIAAVAGESARVLDLGAGPGSLSVRLLDRFPGASAVAVDYDPVTALLGRNAYGTCGGRLRWVDADLSDPAWTEHLAAEPPFDAVVSTTALHWLAAADLAGLYAEVGRLLAPGGVVVNGDHLVQRDVPAFVDLQERLRQLPDDERESWEAWWAALAEVDDPQVAAAFAERSRRRAEHPDTSDKPMLEFHVAALTAAGFTAAGTVWQHGDDRVLVGLR